MLASRDNPPIGGLTDLHPRTKVRGFKIGINNNNMTKNDDLVTKKYLDQKLKSFKRELKDDLSSELKEELYGIKDEIVTEIKAMRDEFDTHQYSHARINDELSEHDKRIGDLEKSQHPLVQYLFTRFSLANIGYRTID